MTLTMNPILKKVPFRQTVHTFEVEGTDYRLDIVETDDMFDLWLYNKDLDMKRYMFGTPKYQQYRHVTETLDPYWKWQCTTLRTISLTMKRILMILRTCATSGT